MSNKKCTFLQSSSKDQHERDVCKQALQMENEQMELRRIETAETLRVLRHELEKSQAEQDKYIRQVTQHFSIRFTQPCKVQIHEA